MSIRSRPRAQNERPSSLSSRSFHLEPYSPSSPSNQGDHLLPAPTTASPTKSTFPLLTIPGPFANSSQSRPHSRFLHRLEALGPLLLYFSLNLLLTLYNKLVLVRFPFPYTLTALHALAGTFGAFLIVNKPSWALRTRYPLTASARAWSLLAIPTALARYTWRLRVGRIVNVFRRRAQASAIPPIPGFISESNFDNEPMTSSAASRAEAAPDHSFTSGPRSFTAPPAKSNNLDLTPKETIVIVAFSFLYTINIAVSNVSLGLVTVPFHQVVRSSTPFFTIALSLGIFGHRASREKLVTLIPVIAGVGFATYGDYYFTPWGFALTLLGTLLAALKTIVTHYLQASPIKLVFVPPKAQHTPVDATVSPFGTVGSMHSADSPFARFSEEHAVVDTLGGAGDARGFDRHTLKPSLSRTGRTVTDVNHVISRHHHNLSVSDLLEAQRTAEYNLHNPLSPRVSLASEPSVPSPSLSLSSQSSPSMPLGTTHTSIHSALSVSPSAFLKKPHPLSIAIDASLSRSASGELHNIPSGTHELEGRPSVPNDGAFKHAISPELGLKSAIESPMDLTQSTQLHPGMNDWRLHGEANDPHIGTTDHRRATPLTYTKSDSELNAPDGKPEAWAEGCLVRSYSDSAAFTPISNTMHGPRSCVTNAQISPVFHDASSNGSGSPSNGPPPPYSSVICLIGDNKEKHSAGDNTSPPYEQERYSEESATSEESVQPGAAFHARSNEVADTSGLLSPEDASVNSHNELAYTPYYNIPRGRRRQGSYASFISSQTSITSLDEFFAARPHPQTTKRAKLSPSPHDQLAPYDPRRYSPPEFMRHDLMHGGDRQAGSGNWSPMHRGPVGSASSTGGPTDATKLRGGLLRPLSPVDLLLLTSPLAFIQCVLIAHFSGELDRVRHYSLHEMTLGRAVGLLLNGMIAFGLNVVSFTANKKIGALGMSVAANVKQVLTILFAVVLFDLHITGMNGFGILLTLIGGALYARVEYREKERKRTAAVTNGLPTNGR